MRFGNVKSIILNLNLVLNFIRDYISNKSTKKSAFSSFQVTKKLKHILVCNILIIFFVSKM